MLEMATTEALSRINEFFLENCQWKMTVFYYLQCTAAIKADLPGDIEKYMNPDTLCALAKLCS